MSQTRSVAVILGAYFKGNPRVIGADERKAPVARLAREYVAALSVIVLFAIAGVAWWAWLVSQELAVAFAEGFREAGLPEE